MHMPNTYRLIDIRPDRFPDLLPWSPVLAETAARRVAATNMPAILLRSQSAYVLLGPQDRRLPKLSDGLRWLKSQGLPVLFRVGGGSAVLLDHHCVSFAVIRPSRDLTAWRTNFIDMTQGVLRGLAMLGVSAQFGEAPGSYCPGPYDLLVAGKKVAGVAQAIRGGYAMVSGMLIVDQDPVATTALLQEFYDRAGKVQFLRSEAVAELASWVPVTVNQVFDAIIGGYSQTDVLHQDPLTQDEIILAQRLYQERNLA